jgi:Ni,Fe-hydrogenase I cytochrome b subunit
MEGKVFSGFMRLLNWADASRAVLLIVGIYVGGGPIISAAAKGEREKQERLGLMIAIPVYLLLAYLG